MRASTKNRLIRILVYAVILLIGLGSWYAAILLFGSAFSPFKNTRQNAYPFALPRVVGLTENSYHPPFSMPKGSVPLRISKETTYVLGPLKRDGKAIDFQRALEEQYTPVCRPEENGFRDVVQAFGRIIVRECSDEHWLDLCKSLSLDPFEPPRFEYVDLFDYIKQNLVSLPSGVTLSQEAMRLTLSCYAPERWTPEGLEYLESWIEQTEPIFPIVEEAVQKPVFFIPPRRMDGRTDLTVGAFALRRINRLFHLHFADRLAHDKPMEAWDDVLLMYQLTKQYARHPFFNSAEIAVGSDAAASQNAQTVLKSALLNEEQLKRCLADLNRLPEWDSFESQIETERLGLLQCISEFSGKGPGAFRIEPFELDPADDRLQEYRDNIIKINKIVREVTRIFRTIPFDWNIVAELANAEYDNLLGMKTKEDLFRSRPQWKKVYETQYKALPTRRRFRKMSLENRSVLLAKLFHESYIPKHEQLERLDAKRLTPLTLAKTMFTLECFKFAEGHYPDTLERLVTEKYLDRVPTDLYRPGKTTALIYRRESPERYTLYSVGINGEDNGGKRWKIHPPDDQNWDDVVVEMP